MSLKFTGSASPGFRHLRFHWNMVLEQSVAPVQSASARKNPIGFIFWAGRLSAVMTGSAVVPFPVLNSFLLYFDQIYWLKKKIEFLSKNQLKNEKIMIF